MTGLDLTPLDKVLAETRRYEHALLDFSARDRDHRTHAAVPSPAQLELGL